MYSVFVTSRFKRSLKRCKKRGLDIAEIELIITLLQREGKLSQKYNPHKLKGAYAKCWECHIQPNWLLVWQQNDTKLTLIMIDTGTHSDLF